MKILQNIIVKQIITEKSKQDLFEQFSFQKQKILKECEQLRFERKRMQSKKNFSNFQFQKYENEISSKKELMEILEFKIEQLHTLPLGSEIKQKEVQAVIEVKIGDRLDALDQTIVVEEGIIVSIR